MKKLIVSTEIKQIVAQAFLSRFGSPDEIVLTGARPPENWIMWMRSDLFWHICGMVYYPESWKHFFTHQYFVELYDIVSNTDIPENSFGDWSPFDDKELRLAFIRALEQCILGETYFDEEDAGIYLNQFDEMEWVPYSEE